MKKKLKVYLPITILSIVFAVSAVFIGIMAINKNKLPDSTMAEQIEQLEDKVNELTEKEIAELKEAAANGVTDEITLRLLLLLQDEIKITVSKDMELMVGMKVNGKKTLTGDANLKMFLGSEKNTVRDGILMVSRGATLDVEGLVLDGNGVCHAILVQEGANLNYNDGTVQYGSPYGIHNLGTTYMNGGTVTKCMAAGIGVATGSKTYVTGGNLKDNYKNHIWSAAASTVEVTGGVFDHSYSHAIHNLGTLKMTGGTIKNSNTADACAVANFGKAYIDGGDDYIEISNCVTGFFSEKDTMEVNKVYGHDLVRNFLRIKAGKGKVTNCKIEKTGTYAVRAGGEVTIENIEAKDLGSHGIYISPGKVTVNNVKVTNAKEYGFVNVGGEAIATNIEITGAGTSAFINYDSTFNGKGEKGLLTLTNCTATDCKSNLIVRGGTSAKVSNCLFNKTIRTNVHVTEGTAELTNVKLLGAKDTDCSVISIRKKSNATLKNVEIASGNRGISLAGKVTVIGGSIHDNKGELAGNAVRAEEKAVYKLENVKIYNNHNISKKMAGGVSFMSKGSKGTIIGCEITNNSSVRTVGGIYAEEAELDIKNTLFKNNETTGAEGDGGAIAMKKTTANIEACKFEGNKTGTAYENVGGAIYGQTDSDLTIKACQFVNNISGRGGAIANVGKLTITEGTTFTGNTCTEGGAGVYNGGNGNVTDTGSVYKENKLTEAHAGGAIRNDGAKTQYTLLDAVLRENSSVGDGGAIYSNGAIFVAENCQFVKNTADQGGAVYVNLTNGEFNGTNCVFKNNSSSNTGFSGGAAFFTGKGHEATLVNDVKKSDDAYDYSKAYFEKNSTQGGGGALLVSANSKVAVTGYKFDSNSAKNGAGAIYNIGFVTDNACIYEANTSEKSAGAVRNYAIEADGTTAQFTKIGGAFYDNEAAKGKNGSAMECNAKTTITLSNVLFEDRSFDGNTVNCLYIGKDAVVKLNEVTLENIGAGKDYHPILNDGGKIQSEDEATKTLTVKNVSGHGLINQNSGTVNLIGVTVQDVIGADRYALRSNSGELNLKDVSIKNVSKDAIYVNGGKATIEDATIEDVVRSALTATDNNSVKGELTAKNVTVKNAGQYGIYCVRGKVFVSGVSIEDIGTTADHHAVLNNAGQIQNVKDATQGITILGAKGNGIANIGKGTISLKGVEIQGVAKKGISSDSGTVTVENAKIKKPEYGVHVLNAGSIVDLKNVTVEDATAVGVYTEKGTVLADELTILRGARGIQSKSGVLGTEEKMMKTVLVQNTTHHSLQSESGTVYVDGIEIKTGSKKGIVVQKGTATIKNATIDGTKESSIYTTADTLTLDGATIKNCKVQAIEVSGGNVTTTTKAITVESSQHGIFIQGGTADMKNLVVKKSTKEAVKIKGGTLTGKFTVTPTSYTIGASIVGKEGSATAETVAAISKLVYVVPDSNGGEWTVDGTGKLAKAYVKVGNKNYANLADAVAGTTDGDTITLLDNVSVSSTIAISKSLTITSSKAVEIQWNSDAKTAMFQVDSGKTLTVKGTGEGKKIVLKKNKTADTSNNVILNKGATVLDYVEIDGGRIGLNSEGTSINVNHLTIKNTADKVLAVKTGNAVIANTTIQNVGASGLFFYTSANQIELNNVTVKGIPSGTGNHGVTVQKGTVTVKNKLTVEDVSGHGIAVTGGTLKTDSATNGTIEVKDAARAGIYATVAINVKVTSISGCAKDVGAKNATITINGTAKKAGSTDTFYALSDF